MSICTYFKYGDLTGLSLGANKVVNFGNTRLVKI